MAENPFAPPALDQHPHVGSRSEGDAWQDGDVLVARDGANLGARCVKCGEPTSADAVKARRLQWYPRWVGLLILLSPLVMIIVMLILMKRATLHAALCSSHYAQWILGQAGGIALIVGSFAVFFLPMLLDAEEAVLFALLGFFACLIAGVVLLVTMGVVFKPQRITNTVGFYKGVHPSILRDLPRWDGSEVA